MLTVFKIDYRLLIPLGVPEIGIEHSPAAHIDVGLASPSPWRGRRPTPPRGVR